MLLIMFLLILYFLCLFSVLQIFLLCAFSELRTEVLRGWRPREMRIFKLIFFRFAIKRRAIEHKHLLTLSRSCHYYFQFKLFHNHDQTSFSVTHKSHSITLSDCTFPPFRRTFRDFTLSCYWTRAQLTNLLKIQSWTLTNHTKLGYRKNAITGNVRTRIQFQITALFSE